MLLMPSHRVNFDIISPTWSFSSFEILIITAHRSSRNKRTFKRFLRIHYPLIILIKFKNYVNKCEIVVKSFENHFQTVLNLNLHLEVMQPLHALVRVFATISAVNVSNVHVIHDF